MQLLSSGFGYWLLLVWVETDLGQDMTKGTGNNTIQAMEHENFAALIKTDPNPGWIKGIQYSKCKIITVELCHI